MTARALAVLDTAAATPGVPLLSPKTKGWCTNAPGKKSGAALKTLTQAVKAAEAEKEAAAIFRDAARKCVLEAEAAKTAAKQSAAHADAVCARAVLLCTVLSLLSLAPWAAYFIASLF